MPVRPFVRPFTLFFSVCLCVFTVEVLGWDQQNDFFAEIYFKELNVNYQGKCGIL